MLKFVLVVVLHIVAILALAYVGISMNDVLQEYAGAVTVLSFSLAVYTTCWNLLYRYNRRFFLFIQKVYETIKHTHTYWKFDFLYVVSGQLETEQIFGHIEVAIKQVFGEKLKKATDSEQTKTYLVRDSLGISCRIMLEKSEVHIYSDRRIPVPSTYSEILRRQLISLAKLVEEQIQSNPVNGCLTIYYESEKRNPYFAFFAQNIPQSNISNFNTVFTSALSASCRYIIQKDSVTVESESLTDLNEGIREILCLRPLEERVQ